jgi:hypothetical protein
MKAVFALAVALLAVQPVQAQYAGGADPVRVAGELQHVGACLYHKYPRASAALLASAPASTEESSAALALRSHYNDCLSADVAGINPDIAGLRGAVAEAAYRGTHTSDPDFSKLDHIPQPLPQAWLGGKAYPAMLAGHDFASCVVAADPQDSALLIRSEPRSTEEKTAIRNLSPAMGPCLVKDSKLTLDAAILRALVSQALYRSVPAWQPAAMKKN